MYSTGQESFWAGNFGTDYTARNYGMDLIASNTALFARALQSTRNILSVLEFGANSGLNLKAISRLFPNLKLSAIEINERACSALRRWGDIDVFEGSIFDCPMDSKHDLTLSKGLLIHINPDMLYEAYGRLYELSNKYILICEYYNPVPVETRYRGHLGRLYKRDFAGDMLDLYPDLSLIDYGFVYHRDANFRQDDATWFLMKKK